MDIKKVNTIVWFGNQCLHDAVIKKKKTKKLLLIHNIIEEGSIIYLLHPETVQHSVNVQI